MPGFAIIETDWGFTLAELENSSTAEEVAVRTGGVVVDAGPFKTHEDAYDALLALLRDEPESE